MKSLQRFSVCVLTCLAMANLLTGYPEHRQRRDVQIDLNAVNAFPSNSAVTFRVLPVDQRIENLKYGEYARAKALLSNESEAEAILVTNNDTVAVKVADLNDRISPNSDGFLVAEPDILSDSLHLTIYLWEVNQAELANKFFLVVHHAFDTKDVDVIAFSAPKLAHGQPNFFRVARSMSLWESQSIKLEEGTYEIKVVPTDTVLSVTQFKNAESLTKSMLFHAANGERHYATIIGRADRSDEYAPQLVSVPPLMPTNRPEMPPSNVYVINGFPTSENVQVNVEGFSYPGLAFGQTYMATYYLERWSSLSVFLGNEKYDFKVLEPVDYETSDCVTVIEPKVLGQNEVDQPHIQCTVAKPLKANETRLRLYNLFYNHTSEIDVIAVPVSEDNATFSLQEPIFVAKNLGFGGEAEVIVSNSSYVLKVFDSSERAAINPLLANPIMPDLYSRLASGKTYFLVISGIQDDQRLPPEIISFPDVLPQLSTTIAMTTPSTTIPSTVTKQQPSVTMVSSTSTDAATTNAGFTLHLSAISVVGCFIFALFNSH